MRKIFLTISMATMFTLTVYTSGVARAQDSSAAPSGASSQNMDQDVEMLRRDLRSQKKQIVAANMQLTDAEAQKFWPVYDQYTAEVTKINDSKVAVIKQYADSYNANNLTDDKALALTKQILDVDKGVVELRQKYIPIFNKVISGQKTALFFQIDRRLVMLIDLQLAAAVPMVGP
jgi:hypothetical protein